MTARDVILHRLRSAVEERTLPSPWPPQPTFTDLVSPFSVSLRAAGGEVHLEDSLESALHKVETILRLVEARAIVANDEPPLSAAVLPQRWPNHEWHIVGQSGRDLREFCARADVGLSGVQGALAETGSLIVTSGRGKSRLATLLPPVHVALVSISSLVPDIFTWTSRREEELPANIILISGPSKTADIEFTLTLGIHGPKRLIAVLYKDSSG